MLETTTATTIVIMVLVNLEDKKEIEKTVNRLIIQQAVPNEVHVPQNVDSGKSLSVPVKFMNFIPLKN